MSSQPVLKTHYGSVKPYTRHTSACPHSKADDYNACACPKWLYIRRHGEKSKRVTLNTPSWEEAQRIAAAKLRAMDPDIAAAQAVAEKHKRKLVTVSDGCKLFLQKVERDKGRKGAYEQYSVAVNHLKAWAEHLRIDHVQDITTLMLERWYSEKPWSDFSTTTRRQVWINVRTIFRFWYERDLLDRNPALAVKPVKRPDNHSQGPYSDEQIKAVMRKVDSEGDPRLRAFIIHLLHVGCDVIDAVLFNTGRIEDVTIDGETIHIYRYRRLKTKVQAIVRLEPEVARTLRSLPRIDGNLEAMPFRDPNRHVISDRSDWSKRVIAVLHAAGVKWVDLPSDDEGRVRRKQANCKQFRHTFAVRQLRDGQMPEDVAKMLGHVNADMVRKHYAPWVPDLEEAYLRRIVRMERN